MRVVALLAIIAVLIGCSWLIPDYAGKKFVRSDITPHVMISVAPSYPHVCLQDKDINGTPCAKVTVIVNLVGMEPQPITILLNAGNGHVFQPDISATLYFNAGEGVHDIRVLVGDREYRRVLQVWNCAKGEE